MEDLPPLPPRTICLIRHGETTANRDSIIAGRLDVALTDHGRSQARSLATLTWEEPITVFCSPMARAKETARLGFPDLVATPHAGLRERDWGTFEGRPLTQLPPREETPDGGDGWRDMILRVHAAIRDCCASAGPTLPVLVCHSGVIRATRLLACLGSVGERPPNAHPVLFRHHAGRHEEHPL